MDIKLLSRALCFLVFFSTLLYSQSQFDESVNQATTYYENRQYSDAIAILEAFYPENRYKLESSLLLIDSYIKTGNYNKANVIINDLVKYHPRAFTVLERKLEILLMQNNLGESRGIIAQILSLDSKNYFASYGEALLNEKTGYMKSAVPLYEKAILISPSRSEAVLGLAYLELKLGNPERAFTLFNRNIKNNPRMAESYYNLANYYYITKNYEKTITELNNAFFYYKDYTDALILKAYTLSELKRYDESLTILKSIDEAHFTSGDKNYIIGALYEEGANYEEAKKYYVKYLMKFPDDELGRTAYERVLFYLYPKANHERDRAGLYYAPLAAYYGRLADPIKGFAYYNRILRLNPANTYARMSLYDIYNTRGYKEKSFEELSIAKNINPTNKDILYKFNNTERMLSRNILSKSWGIDQYALKRPGYTVAITDTLVEQLGSPKMLNMAMYDNLAYALSQYKRMNLVELYTNNALGSSFDNLLSKNNVDFYLTGSISKGKNNISLVLDLIDVRSRRSVTNFIIFKDGNYNMMNASADIGSYINNSIPFYANIIKIYGDSLYINAGKWHGITNGMTFAVYDTDKAYYNIKTKSIDKKPTDIISILKVVSVDENVSLLKALDPRSLNNVRLYQVVAPYTVDTPVDIAAN